MEYFACAVVGDDLVITHRGHRLATIDVHGARLYHDPVAATPAIGGWTGSDLAGWQGLFAIDLPGLGRVWLRDRVRWTAPGELTWDRSWWQEGTSSMTGIELLAGLACTGSLRSHLLPGILYDGNPGAVPERVVPRLSSGENLFEEHRFPTPFVHVLCAGNSADLGDTAISLVAQPCSALGGHLPDQWWSLGLSCVRGQTRLLSRSGRLAINGQDEAAYVGQNRVAPYPEAWLTLPPHQRVEKHYRLLLQVQAGHDAWRMPLRQAITAQPDLTACERAWLNRTAIESAIGLKVGYALRRWIDDGTVSGMNWWPLRSDYAERERAVEYGWVGQNGRLALSLWRWGHQIGDAALQERGRGAMRCWIDQALGEITQGRPPKTLYLPDAPAGRRWLDANRGDGGFSRSIGETLYELALFCRKLREAGAPDLAWEAGLAKLLDWCMAPERRAERGLLPLAWDAHGRPRTGPVVSAGALVVAALAESSRLPGHAQHLTQAEELMDAYAAAFIAIPGAHPCNSALDSGCEDMESGLFLLLALNALAGAGRADARRQAQAGWLADWLLTWTYTWDVPMRPGTILHALCLRTGGMRRSADRASPVDPLDGLISGFTSRGMSDVSVQNRHLHVYSPAAALASHHPAGREQARRMLVPLLTSLARPGHPMGMDEDGEHTEQYNQTCYVQHGEWDLGCGPRGGLARWFVPWMTVWILSTCLEALEEGWSDDQLGSETPAGTASSASSIQGAPGTMQLAKR